MNETLRQHYLQALGIDSYMPRWILPAAAESPLLPAEAPAEEESRPDQAAAVEPARDKPAAAAGRAALIRESTAEPAPSGRKALEGRSTGKPVLHQFALNYWRLGPHIGVLDSRQPGAALPTEQLLVNMGAALGISPSQAPPVTIQWPSPGGSPVATDLARSVLEARDMLRAFLAAQHEKQALHAVWLMGGSAIYHGLSATELGEDAEDRAVIARVLGRRFPVSLRGGAGQEDAGQRVEVIALPGLASMLKKPALKAAAWKAIKHLRMSQ